MEGIDLCSRCKKFTFWNEDEKAWLCSHCWQKQPGKLGPRKETKVLDQSMTLAKRDLRAWIQARKKGANEPLLELNAPSKVSELLEYVALLEGALEKRREAV